MMDYNLSDMLATLYCGATGEATSDVRILFVLTVVCDQSLTSIVPGHKFSTVTAAHCTRMQVPDIYGYMVLIYGIS